LLLHLQQLRQEIYVIYQTSITNTLFEYKLKCFKLSNVKY